MKAIEYLRKGFIFLLLWNVLLTGILIFNFDRKQEEKLNQQICILENIPDFEIIEVE